MHLKPSKMGALAIPTSSFLKEIVRKLIHMSIAFVPTLAKWNMSITVVALSLGILCYVVNETARISGVGGGILSQLTSVAVRPYERGFVWGPVTLGLGALAALVYYPNPAATVALYALAFGDGISGLVGRAWGKIRLRCLGGKTLIGTFSGFLAVFSATYLVVHDGFVSLVVAFVSTILELIPVRDLDNLIIPLGTGFVFILIT